VLIPLQLLLPEHSSLTPLQMYHDMRDRSRLRDFKQLLHRDVTLRTKENQKKIAEDTQRIEPSTQEALQLFQRWKSVCRSFCGRHDFCSFIDQGLPNKGTQYVRDVVSFKSAGDLILHGAGKEGEGEGAGEGAGEGEGERERAGEGEGEVLIKLRIVVDRPSEGLLERVIGTAVAVMRGDLSLDVVSAALHAAPIDDEEVVVVEEEEEEEEGRESKDEQAAGSTSSSTSSELPSRKKRKKQKTNDAPPTAPAAPAAPAAKRSSVPADETKPALVVNLPRAPLLVKYVSKLYLDHIDGEQPTKRYEEEMEAWSLHIEKKLLGSDQKVSRETNKWLKTKYLISCRHVVQQMEIAKHSLELVHPNMMATEEAAPKAYAKVLSMLRSIDREGKWPGTSVNRSKVISDQKKENEKDKEKEITNTAGSFSMGSFAGTAHKVVCPCNDLFPELLKAVFRLESVLLPERRGSSTIAVNKHATFLPHTDSGAGAGQGVSLIVGLGQYAGGALMVEGNKVDIRYTPVEFDGWKERHWTLPHLGERYSLVWFTPQGCEDVSWLKE